MRIFIDESGTFVPSRDGSGLSLVGALTIADGRLAQIERRYARIRPHLPKERREVKGRLLAEPHVAAVVDLLRRNEALLELTAIDANLHEPQDIAAHRVGQARGMTSGLTDAHHPNVWKWAERLAARVAALNDQLYLQSVAMFDLVWRTSEHSINYFAQRQPRELSAFHWTIDGKDRDRRTNWEQLWSDIVMPVLQSRSIREPQGLFEEADFTFFERFQTPIPDWLPRPAGRREETGTDIKLLLMEHFRYSSGVEPGLEWADIATNAARRALVGTLQRDGWRGVPSLMIHRRGRQYINIVQLHNRPAGASQPYEEIMMRYFARGGRSMLAPRFAD